MFVPRCGCCPTGSEYVARHLDPADHLPVGVDPRFLANEMCGNLVGWMVPSHLPPVEILALWIAQRQNEKQLEAA